MVLSEGGHHGLLIVRQVMEFPLSSWYVQSHCLHSGGKWIIPLHTGKGVPNRLALVNNHAQPVSAQVIPSVDDAIQQYEAMGGHLTLFSPFGKDLLADHPDLVAERERQYYGAYPDFATIFHEISNGHTQLFEGGLQLFLQLTEQLSQHIQWTVINVDL